MDEDSELDATSNRLFGHLPRRSEPFSMRGSSRLRLPPVLQEYSQQTQPPKRREFSRVQSYSTKPRKTIPAFGLSDLSADSDPNDYHTEVTPKRPSSDISNYPDYLSVANAAFKVDPLPSSKYPVLDTPKYDSKDGKRDPAYDMMQSNDQIVQIIPYVPCRPDGPHSAWRDRPSGVCAASSELGHVCGNIYKMFEVSISEGDCGDFDGHWCCYGNYSINHII